jgi:hypothetical protein
MKAQEHMKRQGRGKKTTATRKQIPTFEGCKFGFELSRMVVLPSGQWQATVLIPAEDREAAYALSLAPGLLLEASVTAVEGIIK